VQQETKRKKDGSIQHNVDSPFLHLDVRRLNTPPRRGVSANSITRLHRDERNVTAKTLSTDTKRFPASTDIPYSTVFMFCGSYLFPLLSHRKLKKRICVSTSPILAHVATSL